jgi:hypothetical protein
MKKLPAFTLLELLIGMIISSLVIASAYYAYAIIYDRYEQYRLMKKKLLESEQFQSVLNNDAYISDVISFNDDQLVMTKPNGTSVQYHFYDRLITRAENDRSDTFALVAVNIKSQFLFPEDQQFVQQFSFETQVLEEHAFFSFTKAYPSELLVNYKKLNTDQ